MKVSLFIVTDVTANGQHERGRSIPATVSENGQHVFIAEPCPRCAKSGCEIRGAGITHHDHDTYYARAIALCCGAHVGELRATVDTIFGIEEDERVLNGRPRVY